MHSGHFSAGKPRASKWLRREVLDERPANIGHYANNLQVGFNRAEFVLDFGQLYPSNEPPVLTARILTSPLYASAFAKVLSESVKRYEKEYGPIAEE
jgi:hypothetical protein